MEVETTMGAMPEELDKLKAKNWYFTIGKGKAKYHIWSLADNSCGLHYCYRMNERGRLFAKRAVNPTKKVIIHYDK